MENFEIIVEILQDLFENEKNHNELTCQISFDCPVCSYEIKSLGHGDGKGNLEINYKKEVYKCWSCSETHNTFGHLGKLIEIYGSKEDKRLFGLVRNPDNKIEQKKKKDIPRLPKEFKKFDEVSDIHPEKKRAIRYLTSRGIDKVIIDYFNIGFCMNGDYAGRIVIPSYNYENKLNYFVARTWNDFTKVKYKNPQYDKNELIFNENKINWDQDIWIVEGVFDSFFVNNSIPLLGKYMNDYLFDKIYTESKKNIIICLDSDAWNDSVKLYHKLNGGKLYGKIKIVKMPDQTDIADIKGQIKQEYFQIIR